MEKLTYVVCVALYLWCAREIASFYKHLYFIGKYDYAHLDDSDYEWKLGWSKKCGCHKNFLKPEMMNYLKNGASGDVLNQHKGRVVELIFLDNQKFVAKRKRKDGFFANLLEMSLGVRIWNNAHMLKEKGIETLMPVALIERRGLTWSESCVLYPYEGTSITSQDHIRDIANLLKHHSILHTDFRPKNFIQLEDGHIRLIDIDDIHPYPFYAL